MNTAEYSFGDCFVYSKACENKNGNMTTIPTISTTPTPEAELAACDKSSGRIYGHSGVSPWSSLGCHQAEKPAPSLANQPIIHDGEICRLNAEFNEKCRLVDGGGGALSSAPTWSSSRKMSHHHPIHDRWGDEIEDQFKEREGHDECAEKVEKETPHKGTADESNSGLSEGILANDTVCNVNSAEATKPDDELASVATLQLLKVRLGMLFDEILRLATDPALSPTPSINSPVAFLWVLDHLGWRIQQAHLQPSSPSFNVFHSHQFWLLTPPMSMLSPTNPKRPLLIADFHFLEDLFSIARPSATFLRVFGSSRREFIGPVEDLSHSLDVLAKECEMSFASQGMPMAPWRARTFLEDAFLRGIAEARADPACQISAFDTGNMAVLSKVASKMNARDLTVRRSAPHSPTQGELQFCFDA